MKKILVYIFFTFFSLTNLSKAELAISPCVKVYNEIVKNFETIHPDEIDAYGAKEYQFEIDYICNYK